MHDTCACLVVPPAALQSKPRCQCSAWILPHCGRRQRRSLALMVAAGPAAVDSELGTAMQCNDAFTLQQPFSWLIKSSQNWRTTHTHAHACSHPHTHAHPQTCWEVDVNVPLAGGAGGVPRQAQRGGVGAHPGQRDARAFLQHIAQLACMMHRRRCRAHQHSTAQHSTAQHSTAQRGSERSGDGGQCVLGRQTRQSIHPLASHPLRSPLTNNACMHAPTPTHMHCLSAPVSVSWPLAPALPAPTQMHSMYWSLPPTEVHTSPAAVPGDATRSAGRKEDPSRGYLGYIGRPARWHQTLNG